MDLPLESSFFDCDEDRDGEFLLEDDVFTLEYLQFFLVDDVDFLLRLLRAGDADEDDDSEEELHSLEDESSEELDL